MRGIQWHSSRESTALTVATINYVQTLKVTKGTALVDPLKGDGTTPLITAAMMGHARVVKLLLDEGMVLFPL
jgi:ankyrin repeat protein